MLQKKLIVEMILDVLSLDAQTVTDLEYACEGVSPLQFNVPQGATGGNVRYHYKPDFTARFNKQKMCREERRRQGKAIGRAAMTCGRSGITWRTLQMYFVHNVKQRELNPRPTTCTMRTHASIATPMG